MIFGKDTLIVQQPASPGDYDIMGDYTPGDPGAEVRYQCDAMIVKPTANRGDDGTRISHTWEITLPVDAYVPEGQRVRLIAGGHDEEYIVQQFQRFSFHTKIWL